MGGMQPHAQGRLELPNAERGRREPPLVPVKGSGPGRHLEFGIWSPELGENIFLWL